ncbi:MAG: hypothetical protein AABW89_01830 [Nanoarchaeota archaeon]
MNLKELIEKYSILQKKYSLPGFDELNSAFDIGKIRRDSGNLIRDIRRMMIEKIVYYLKLIEVIMNPSQASPIFMMLLKDINPNDLKIMDSLLSPFVELELKAHKLDVYSTEKEESQLVSRIFNCWVSKRSELGELITVLERNWSQIKSVPKKSRDYFS